MIFYAKLVVLVPLISLCTTLVAVNLLPKDKSLDE